MGIMQAALSSVVTIVAYGLLLAGVYKVFQIQSVLAEIRDTLKDIRRNTDSELLSSPKAAATTTPQALPSLYESPDAVIRALTAEPEPHTSQHS